MSDASFRDGAEKPLRLMAQDHDDLNVISSLAQDAIAERKEMLYEPKKRSFSLLLKRFRWEDAEAAKKQNRAFERIQSVLIFQSVNSVRYNGFNADDRKLAFDLIGIRSEENTIYLVFAGDGEIALDCECVDAILTDVSRPYQARSQSEPQHQSD